MSIEDLFDFDTLLEQLGARTDATPEPPAAVAPASQVPSMLDKVELPANDSDPFALLERHLREGEEQRAAENLVVFAARQREEQTIVELEDWLRAIVRDRDQPAVS